MRERKRGVGNEGRRRRMGGEEGMMGGGEREDGLEWRRGGVWGGREREECIGKGGRQREGEREYRKGEKMEGYR